MYHTENYLELIPLFVENLLPTNRGYDFFVNWENAKLYKEFEIELNAMNVLIRNDEMDEVFYDLVKKLPTVINTFPLLFALSKGERDKLWRGKNKLEIASLVHKTIESFDFSRVKTSEPLTDEDIEEYYLFFIEMGLQDLFKNFLEKSVVDYVIGVLVGLDSNGRKNRSGSSFENLCMELIKPICKKYEIELLPQNQFKVLEDRGLKISEDIKYRKADFILVKDEKVVNIEANYYFAAGSKPEEIVDSYINRKNDLKKNEIDFILITDGFCWQNENKNQLNKAFRYFSILNYYMVKTGYLEKELKTIFELE
ncbi:DpnII family type II restriction endonuclease [Lagierella sp. ICN-221743]